MRTIDPIGARHFLFAATLLNRPQQQPSPTSRWSGPAFVACSTSTGSWRRCCPGRSWSSAPTATAGVAAGVYAASVCALFGVSALYHRITWTPPARRWLRHLDHAMIFMLIAGTYTPVGLLVLKSPLAAVVLVVVWSGALVGIALNLGWRQAPSWVGVAVYVALGWVAVVALPQLLQHLGWWGPRCWLAAAWRTRRGRWCTPVADPTRPRRVRLPRDPPPAGGGRRCCRFRRDRPGRPGGLNPAQRPLRRRQPEPRWCC